jgi:hypothetical protein
MINRQTDERTEEAALLTPLQTLCHGSLRTLIIMQQQNATPPHWRSREREKESSVVAAQRRHVLVVKVQSKMEMVGEGNKSNSTRERVLPAFFLAILCLLYSQNAILKNEQELKSCVFWDFNTHNSTTIIIFKSPDNLYRVHLVSQIYI